jgi:hypothetical protein
MCCNPYIVKTATVAVDVASSEYPDKIEKYFRKLL